MIEILAILRYDMMCQSQSDWLTFLRCNAANHPMQPSGEAGRFKMEDHPSPPADR